MTHRAVERATRLGRVRGFERLGVETYRGLRYASSQRFRASTLDATPWTGTRDATRHGAMAMQGPISTVVFGAAPEASNAEDCLFLNVHAPAGGRADAKKPVILFIHGGSFGGGSGSCYDGTALASGADAVVVCINYRLGVFAGFDLDWLGTAHDGGGQLWLGDQINSLRWVRDNIADYGGDPERVTIIGESAGGVSVAALCAAPAAAGLVHRAVACSTGYMPQEPSRDALGAVAKARKCGRDEALAWMQAATSAELMALQGTGPVPVAGTPMLPGTMEELIAARGAQAVPMIAGYATHEGVAIEVMAKASTRLPGFVISLIAHMAAKGIAMHAAHGKANVKAYLKRLKKAAGVRGFGTAFNDAVWTDGFRRGACDYADMTTAAGSRAWIYAIDLPMRMAGVKLPSSHGIDVALTFNPYDDASHTVPRFVDHPLAAEIARRWVRMLGHFARTGEPGDALGDWPAYEPVRRASLLIEPERCHVKDHIEAKIRAEVWR